MGSENFTLSAWHESGRVVYAYKSGYNCDSIEIPDLEPGNGISKLNGKQDTEYIKLILNNQQPDLNRMSQSKVVEVAQKLLKIYCAATCTSVFFRTGGQITHETEIEIPGQDMKHIQIIQAFLDRYMQGYKPNYLNQIISQVFIELKNEETWKTIETLVAAILKNEEKKINRFTIEDALMKSGFKPITQQVNTPIEIKLKEDEASPIPANPVNLNPSKEKILDDVLKKFLSSIKKELNEKELDAAVVFLKDVFTKFN